MSLSSVDSKMICTALPGIREGSAWPLSTHVS
jgi:hypothetical protein